MTDYKLAHTLKELNDYADKGYVFVAVINPDSWLVRKEEDEVVADAGNTPTLPIEEKEPVKKDNGLGTNKKDA